MSNFAVAQQFSLDDPSFYKTAHFVLAKQWKLDSLNKATHIDYRIRDNGMEQVYIYNAANIYEGVNPKKNFNDLKAKISDKLNLAGIFNSAFTEARMNELMDNDEYSIFMFFKISVQGDLLEVAFILRMKTLITPNEVEALETGLKKNFKMTITSPTDGGDFIVTAMSYRFSDALAAKN